MANIAVKNGVKFNKKRDSSHIQLRMTCLELLFILGKAKS